MYEKNVFIKIIFCLMNFAIFFCGVIYAVPKFEISNNVLNIQSSYLGDLTCLNLGCNKNYEKVVVKGRVGYFDLMAIKSVSEDCKTIDLSEARCNSEFCADVFINLSNLESFIFPKNLEDLSEGALNDCPKLRSVVLPSRLRFIGPNSFQNCLNLESVNLPLCLRRIGPNSFKNCPNLKLKISSRVNIGEGTFCGSPGVVILGEKINKAEYKDFSLLSFFMTWTEFYE